MKFLLSLVLVTSCGRETDQPKLNLKEQTLNKPTVFHIRPRNGYEKCENVMGMSQFNKHYAEDFCREECLQRIKDPCDEEI